MPLAHRHEPPQHDVCRRGRLSRHRRTRRTRRVPSCLIARRSPYPHTADLLLTCLIIPGSSLP